MAERYTRVFSLDKDLYADGSPVLIKAGALLLDNKNNTVLAQMKFQNIGTKRIKALTVGITPLDVAGDINGEEIEFQYLDMSSGRDEIFGEQTPIALPDNTTRGFLVNVKSAVYEDNGRKVVSSTKWGGLPAQETLLHRLGDDYAVKQFREQYHVDFDYVPVKHKDIWLCGCRAINSAAENNCHCCHFQYEKILTVNDDELRHKGEEVRKEEIRIRQEQQEEAERLRREEEERRLRREEEWKKEQANRRKRIKKISIIAACAVVIIGVIFGCYKYLPPIFTQMEAEKAYDSGDYDKAIELYESINADKKFDTTIKECYYQMGIVLMEEENYEAAREAFSKSSSHADLRNRIAECNLKISKQKATEAIKSKDYEKAVFYLEKMPDGYMELTEEDKKALYDFAKKQVKREKYKSAIRCFSFIRNYKDTKKYINYTDALQYMLDGNLEAARKILSSLDLEGVDTSKYISLIDQYAKYSGKWICWWERFENADGLDSIEDDRESEGYHGTKNLLKASDMEIIIEISKKGTVKARSKDLFEWGDDAYIIRDNNVTWENKYDAHRFVYSFNFSTGEMIRTTYNADGSWDGRITSKYRRE